MTKKTRSARVRAFVDAVRTALPIDDAGFVEALAIESRLSRGGVRAAFAHALELSATDAEIDAMVARARPTPATALVLASNVFTAPFRAIAWALAGSAQVTVRSSRRARIFPRALVDALAGSALEGQVTLDESDDPLAGLGAIVEGLPDGAALHVYGGDESALSIFVQVRHRRDLALELHASGIGIVVARAAAIAASADAIARDVALFDQAGCVSPRIVIAIGTPAARATAGAALHTALSSLERTIPRGPLDDELRAEITSTVDSLAMVGEVLLGDAHAVFVPCRSMPILPAPTGRLLPVYGATSVEAALGKLGLVARFVSCIATEPTQLAHIRAEFPDVRVVALGTMQRPPFDGPVDLRPLFTP